MRISFLCSDPAHPVSTYLRKWIEGNKNLHQIELLSSKKHLSGGDLLFLVSCTEIISSIERENYKKTLVLHASDLPRGRGWSPHIWELIAGANEITLSLLEADEQVDTGKIWRKSLVPIPKHALWDEINAHIFEAELQLIDFAVREFGFVCPTPQDAEVAPTYYPRRTPDNSRIDPWKSIADQFDTIRVSDPNRFPAFFELYGKKYKLTLEKLDG